MHDACVLLYLWLVMSLVLYCAVVVSVMVVVVAVSRRLLLM